MKKILMTGLIALMAVPAQAETFYTGKPAKYLFDQFVEVYQEYNKGDWTIAFEQLQCEITGDDVAEPESAECHGTHHYNRRSLAVSGRRAIQLYQALAPVGGLTCNSQTCKTGEVDGICRREKKFFINTYACNIRVAL